MKELRYTAPDRRKIESDFTVIGAGLAGMVAAVSAARHGLKVALVNDRSVVGGNASSEIGVGISGSAHGIYNPSIYARECGIVEELRNMLTEYSKTGAYGNLALMDAAFTDFLRQEKNITLYSNTTVTDVVTDGNRICSVIGFHSKADIWYEFSSPLFADCSGDGVVALKAGAAYLQGRDSKADFGEFWAPEEADTTTMGNTLFFETQDVGHKVTYTPPKFAYDITKMEFMKWIHRPENFRGFSMHGAGWTLEVGGHWDIIKDSEKISDELRNLIFGIWDYVKNSGRYPADNFVLKRVYTMMGMRESRRFIGDYILTENDIEQKTDFFDAVCIGGWPMDVHAPKGLYDELPASHFIPVTSIYNIPFRCLYTRDVSNLMLAGRNISASHIAMGSTRVMATCACMGQAIGTAAALCKADGVLPAKVDIPHLQRLLIQDDQSLVGFYENLQPELYEGWQVTASSVAVCENPIADACTPLHWNHGISVPMVTECLEKMDLHLKNTASLPQILQIDVLTGECKSSYLPNHFVRTVEVSLPAQFDGWKTVSLNAPKGIDGKVHLVLRQNEQLSVYTAEKFPLGVISYHYYTEGMREGYDHDTHPLDKTCGYIGKDQKAKGYKYVPSICFRNLMPEQPVYQPENILNGYSRPYGLPNLWISEKGKGQWISLHNDIPKHIRELQIIFDTGLNTEERRYYDAPELVKSYRLTINGKEFTETDNNYRLKRYFPEEDVTDICLEIFDTHGSDCAHVYALRFFD